MKKKYNKLGLRVAWLQWLMLLVLILTSGTAMAESFSVTSTAEDTPAIEDGDIRPTFISSNCSGFIYSEAPSYLLDSDGSSTKWTERIGSGGKYVICKTPKAIFPQEYKLTTGNDTESWPDRNWKSWRIYGANFNSDSEATDDAAGWTLIDQKTNITTTSTPSFSSANQTASAFSVTGTVHSAYSYYKIVVDAAIGTDLIQMSDFVFSKYSSIIQSEKPETGLYQTITQDDKTYYSIVFVSGIKTSYIYTGDDIAVTPVVTDATGKAVSSDNYTVTLTKDGTAVSALNAIGNYELTITGQGSLSGTQTYQIAVSEADFVINSDADWNTFVNSVNGDNNYEGKTVKLNENITITTTAGTMDHPFKGTFDGTNHKLTLSITTPATAENNFDANKGWGPFRFTDGATIKNLWTAGTITCPDGKNDLSVGGIIGRTIGSAPTTVSNCRSSVTIDMSAQTSKRDFTAGGIIGCTKTQGATIDGCLFDGTLTGSNAMNNGGIVGWSAVETTISNTVQAGTFSTSNEGCGTISRNATLVTLENCYYVNDYSTTEHNKYSSGAPIKVYTSEQEGFTNKQMTLFGITYYYPVLAGSGSEADPFLIKTVADWNLFAQNVNNGTDYSGLYVQLYNGINDGVTTTVGTEAHPFKGTFDGNEKTLAVNINDESAQGTAPFRYISGATIKNLKVTGEVKSGSQSHSAGLVGFVSAGTNTIDGCHVSTNVTSTGYHGGVVGHAGKATLTIRNTIYDGTLSTAGSGQYVGGFQGWSDGNTLTLDNCLFTGTCEASTFHPVGLYYYKNTMNATVSKVYYTATPTLTTADNQAAPIFGGTRVSATKTSDDDEAVTATDGNTYYTMADLTISSDAEWTTFAESVTNGNKYEGMYVKLLKDINVTTKAGVDGKPFRGTFDGGNHTMTLNMEATTNGCAPFHAPENATIKNLNIAGTITTSGKFAASLAVYTYGTTIIDNCHSTVSITSTVSGDGTNGGFAGVIQNGTLSFNKCSFKGKFLGSNTNSNGGFVGWANSNVSYTDCLFAPTEVTMVGDGTFNRNGKNTFTRAYYTQAFGAAQGTRVYTEVPSDVVYQQQPITAADGKNYYAPVTISGVESKYQYSGSEIPVNPVLTSATGETLVSGTDYSYSINPSTVKEQGSYTLTITGKGSYQGTQTMTFSVIDPYEIISTDEAVTWSGDHTYTLKSDATISKRVTVSGKATIVLQEGYTLNIPKGICVNSGNELTIEGSGTLNCNDVEEYCAGIGGNRSKSAGTITINGGNINVSSGKSDAAAIGGGSAQYWDDHCDGGVITINGGHVKASALDNNDIGGGFQGSAGTITINGGQVEAPHGIGDGPVDDFKPTTAGSITLGWTNSTDYIEAKYNLSLSTLSFKEGKTFLLSDTKEIATTSNINGKKIIPDAEYDISCKEVKGVKPVYSYTGEEISVIPQVFNSSGVQLTEGTDYTYTIAPSVVKDGGNYTITITGIGKCKGTQTVTFIVAGGILSSDVTEWIDGGNYIAKGNLEISSRIKVNGKVTLVLDDGCELKAPKGIAVLKGNELTIEGKGALTINNVDFNYAGIGGNDGKSSGLITINGGTITATGGDASGAGIGGGYGCDGTVIINGGTVTATGGHYAAGIGGGEYGDGTVTINGGIIIARSVYGGAGIGGGMKGGGTVSINGGQITTKVNQYLDHNRGIGAGQYATSASVTLGWTNASDFIQSYYTADNISFVEGKQFLLDGTTTVATTGNIDGKKIVPLIDDKDVVSYSVSGLEKYYRYDGTAIHPEPIVTDTHGNQLKLGTDYTLSYSDGCVDAGTYTITVNGIGNYHGSKSVSFVIRRFVMITFKSNKFGIGDDYTQEVEYNQSANLTANTFTYRVPDYVFDGWNTAADGTGTSYADKAAVTLTDNTTLYAQWRYQYSDFTSINMPVSGTRTVDLSNYAGVTNFKVYDDGGPITDTGSGSFTRGCDGYLQIIAPEGYTINVKGSVKTDLNSNGHTYLSVYDGDESNKTAIKEGLWGGNEVTDYYTIVKGGMKFAIKSQCRDVDLTSTSNKMLLYFHSDDGALSSVGLDLTVTLIQTKVTASTTAPITVDNQESYWGTLYVGDKYNVPSGVKVYGITKVENGYAKLTQVADGGQVIPAGGYILNTDAKQTSLEFTRAADGNAVTFTDAGYLKGATTKTAESEDGYLYYILGRSLKDGSDSEYNYSFQWQNPSTCGVSDGTAVVSNANKAYLKVSKSASQAKSLTFVFDDGTTTGIHAVVEHLNGQAYNLQGLPVSDSYKGIVIINGKKYVRKWAQGDFSVDSPPR